MIVGTAIGTLTKNIHGTGAMSPDKLPGYVLNNVAIIHDRQNTARTTAAPAIGTKNMLNVRQLT
jgi:hypothetical protein